MMDGTQNRGTGFFQQILSKYTIVSLVMMAILLLMAATQVSKLKIDASADSLMLENDPDLAFYREVNERYGANDFLLVTFTPHKGVFDEDSLSKLQALKSAFLAIPRVQKVQSILDVPLLFSPKLELSEISKSLRTIENKNVDMALAQTELVSSPFYKDLLLSRDKATTALQIVFERDETYFSLLASRNDLLAKSHLDTFGQQDQKQLDKAVKLFDEYKNETALREKSQTDEVRRIVQSFAEFGSFSIGGASMISSDIVSFIADDLQIFGVSIVLFIIFSLVLFFRQLRWVLVPLICCLANVVLVSAILTLLNWKVSIISSNYISLLLILTMSICIHLIVKYRELRESHLELSHEEVIELTLAQMFKPCLYTTLTTVVAFLSLLLSGIRPVINFGWIMTIGVSLAFILSFILFPTLLKFFPKDKVKKESELTQKVMGFIALCCIRSPKGIMVLFSLASVFAIYGISQLSVENRFIDYFKEDTEIFKGMLEIDTKLGGTTSFEIILDAPQTHLDKISDQASEDEDDDFGDFEDEGSDPIEDSYWYTPKGLERLEAIHDYVDDLPQTGKVLSLATTYKIATEFNDGLPFSKFELLFLYNALPELLKKELIGAYLSEDGNQIRISTRIIDSNKEMNRNDFIGQIRTNLLSEFELEPQQVRLSGLLVLYNNLLQSLFGSQIKTIGFVFVAIFIMFLFIFRSFSLSLIAIVPNLISATLILGFIGLIGLPLDFMTITVASITIGIAVDDTIHYLHRFKDEISSDGKVIDSKHFFGGETLSEDSLDKYAVATINSHTSTGKAMYYTSITIIAGFSILVLSNFNPSMYFGLLTGLAMFIALASNLLLLPVLLGFFKPQS